MSDRNILQKLFHDRVYCVCYKEISNIPFYKKINDDKFNVIKPSLLYWYADPFVTNINNKEYLFVEKCNRITGKGVISFFEITKNNNSKIKNALIEKFHLSFPNIFEYKGEIYMIPETEGDKAINIYKMGNNIEQWNKIVRYPLEGIVDTAVLKEDDKLVLVTSKEYDENVRMSKSVAYVIEDFPKCKKIKNISDEYFKNREFSYRDRNGGNIIVEKDRKYRVIQNSTEKIYGRDISIKLFNTPGEEKEILRITAKDIKTKNKICKSKDLLGIHTYNTDGKYETVDLYYESYSFFNIFIKFFSIMYKFINNNQI